MEAGGRQGFCSYCVGCSPFAPCSTLAHSPPSSALLWPQEANLQALHLPGTLHADWVWPMQHQRDQKAGGEGGGVILPYSLQALTLGIWQKGPSRATALARQPLPVILVFSSSRNSTSSGCPVFPGFGSICFLSTSNSKCLSLCILVPPLAHLVAPLVSWGVRQVAPGRLPALGSLSSAHPKP